MIEWHVRWGRVAYIAVLMLAAWYVCDNAFAAVLVAAAATDFEYEDDGNG